VCKCYLVRTIDHGAPRTIAFGLSVCCHLEKFGVLEMLKSGFETKSIICEPYFDERVCLLIL
jgi:hypothetical protein